MNYPSEATRQSLTLFTNNILMARDTNWLHGLNPTALQSNEIHEDLRSSVRSNCVLVVLPSHQIHRFIYYVLSNHRNCIPQFSNE